MTFAKDNNLLFYGGEDMHNFLRRIENSIPQYVDGIPENKLIQTDEETLIAHCVSEHSIDPITLHEDQMIAEPEESQTDVSHDRNRVWPGDSSGPVYVSSLKITYRIPYTGQYELWKITPSTRRSTAPRANLLPPRADQPGELIIIVNRPSDVGADEFKRLYEQTIENVRFYVSNQNNEINGFNAKLPNLVKSAIDARKAKLNTHKDILEQLNIPLKPRADAPSFDPIPVKKVVVPLPTPPASNEKPEPGITEDVYNHILKIIRHEGLSWEASPKTYAVHGEEELRDIVLSHLNTHFEGKASAETFRKKGKTDIRIEAEDRAAFVAECKIWGGQKAVGEALDQLLGYLTWRDCKASLMFFNKDVAGFSDILTKLPQALEAHPNYKRKLFEEKEKGEWRFLFKPTEDDQREITVQVFVFNIYTS